MGRTTKFRCRFCRFPVDANKRTTTQAETVTDGFSYVIDATNKVASSAKAGSGCPNCGSLNWTKKKPHGPIIRPEDRPGMSGNNKYPRRGGRF